MIVRAAAASAVSLLVVACGPRSSGTAAGADPAIIPTDDTGGEATARYPRPKDQAMFQQGTSWTFATVRNDKAIDDHHPAADEHGNVETSEPGPQVTCTVAEVRQFAAGVLGRIDCGGPLAVGLAEPLSSWCFMEDVDGRRVCDSVDVTDPLAGWWAATDDGLWRVSEDAVAAAELTLDPDARYLYPADSRTPRAGSWQAWTNEQRGRGKTVTITQRGDAWCVEELHDTGYTTWFRLCLDAAGPVSGSGGWSYVGDRDAEPEVPYSDQERTFTREP